MARTNDEHAAKLREKLNAAHDTLEQLKARWAAASTELDSHLGEIRARVDRAKELGNELEDVRKALKLLGKIKG